MKVVLGDGLVTHTTGWGWYSIEDVPVGVSYPLEASAYSGYRSRSVGTVVAGDRVDFALAPNHIGVGTISGKVANATSGAGVSRARVRAGFGLEAFTDADGNYTLANVPEGTYYLQAYAGGHEAETAQVTVASGGALAQDFSLKPNASAGWIEGWIFRPDRGRIDGAVVTVGGRTVLSGRRPVSGDRGYYFISGLAPGNYTLEVTKDGYTSRSTVAVTVNPGSGTWINMVLTPTGTVSGVLTGVVKNAVNGDPIAGARVWVGDGLVVVSGADGTYRIPDLPTGTYDLRASQSGYQERLINGVPVTGGEAVWNIALTPSSIARGNIQGYVIDALSGENLGGVKVVLGDGLVTHTTGWGWYSIEDVPVGVSYPLEASAYSGYRSRSVGTVVAGDRVDFALAPNHIGVGTISGKVANATSGAGVSRARVRAGFGLEAFTDADGNYTLANVPEGTYYLQAYAGGHEAETAQVTVASGGALAQDFSLKPNASAGWIEGWIFRPDRGRIDGAVVTVGGRTVLSGRRPVSGDRGYYFISGLAPGNYDLVVSKNGFVTATARVTINPGAGTRRDVELQLRTEQAPVAQVLEPAPGAVVRGVVRITGIASDEDFEDYKLEYAPVSDPDAWQLITIGTVPMVLDTLAVWDASSVSPADYNLRLTVNDQAGNTSTAVVAVTVKTPLKVTSVIPGAWVTATPVKITISGRGFAEGVAVRVGNYAWAEVISVTDREIAAVVPGIVTPGRYDVLVVNPDGDYYRAVEAFVVDYGPVVFVDPSVAGIGPNQDVTLTVMVKDVANLYAGDLLLQFDPGVLTVVGGSADVTVNTSEVFSTAASVVVDNTAGTVQISATRTRDQYGYAGYSGSTWLTRIKFRTLAIGESPVVLARAEFRGNTGGEGSMVALVPVGRQDGLVVVGTAGTVVGWVRLEGVGPGHDLSGITVEIGDQTATTGADGKFRLTGLAPGAYTLTAYQPVYLKAGKALNVTEGAIIQLGETLLLTGDVVVNNSVQLADLVALRTAYGTSTGQAGYNSNADLNWNGRVDLVDLVLLARNYGLVGYGGEMTQ
ncbi:MAG: PEGA domain-containing protein [Clostridia bacterium]|nr:MAG: PEGA domain-containing protein [Clostridia bacterium]